MNDKNKLAAALLALISAPITNHWFLIMNIDY